MANQWTLAWSWQRRPTAMRLSPWRVWPKALSGTRSNVPLCKRERFSAVTAPRACCSRPRLCWIGIQIPPSARYERPSRAICVAAQATSGLCVLCARPLCCSARRNSMAQYAVVGRPQIRIDASSKVQGKARYVADLQADSAAHGAILRSPYHHARILAIDTSQAQAYPGVLAVLTAANVPGRNGFGVIIPDQPVLAEDVVRFQGEAVALLVAESERTARKALALVHVEYEPLPPVFGPH